MSSGQTPSLEQAERGHTSHPESVLFPWPLHSLEVLTDPLSSCSDLWLLGEALLDHFSRPSLLWDQPLPSLFPPPVFQYPECQQLDVQLFSHDCLLPGEQVSTLALNSAPNAALGPTLHIFFFTRLTCFWWLNERVQTTTESWSKARLLGILFKMTETQIEFP